MTKRRRLGLPPTDTERLAQEDRIEEEWLQQTTSRHQAQIPLPIDGQGRESGSDEWKKQRGEDGAGSPADGGGA